MAVGVHGVLGMIVQSRVLAQPIVEPAHVLTLRHPMVDMTAMAHMKAHQLRRNLNHAM